jgi:hypothetical protein
MHRIESAFGRPRRRIGPFPRRPAVPYPIPGYGIHPSERYVKALAQTPNATIAPMTAKIMR